MDNIIRIIGIGLVSIILIGIIKQYRPEFVIYILLVSGILIIYMVLNEFTNIINMIREISNKTKLNTQFLGLLLKMTGIAYLSEFAISICKDSGESSIANKVEMGSKILLVSMSIPIISNLLEVILKIIPK